MKCHVCFTEFIGFIGGECTCNQGSPVTPVIPDGSVVNNGVQVVVDGNTVVHTGA